MANILPPALQELIDELSRLPTIGQKTAARLAFFLFKQSKKSSSDLAHALESLHDKVQLCQQCFTMSENKTCTICSDKSRDQGIICVVEEPLDIVALERSQAFNGLYHVLHGALSPIDGVGPKELRIKELLTRLKKEKIKEVVLATNPSLEGEATATYLQKELKGLHVKITRIARGLPTGGDVEYADEVTLANALKGRQEIK